MKRATLSDCWRARRASAVAGAFTLLELLAIIAILGILAALLFPALAGAKSKAHAIECLNNERQLTLACFQYATDRDDALPYNLGQDEIRRSVAEKRYVNWTSSVMNWELDADNTNTVLLTQGGIGAEVSGTARVYRCPSDSVVSDLQSRAGWSRRVRSYSMNAMVGNPGEYTRGGTNVNNPDYRQFFKLGDIPEPSRIFLFIEEHPDSVNDGYFLNKPASMEWIDLPASYHSGGANIAFADGHITFHKWRFASTRPAARPYAVNLPLEIPADESGDFRWLMWRTSVENSHRRYSSY